MPLRPMRDKGKEGGDVSFRYLQSAHPFAERRLKRKEARSARRRPQFVQHAAPPECRRRHAPQSKVLPTRPTTDLQSQEAI